MSVSPLPPGKLPAALLTALLAQDAPTDPRVLIGPRAHEWAIAARGSGVTAVTRSD